MSDTPIKEEDTKKDMKDVLAAVESIKCIVQKYQKFVEEFLSEPMCGKCHPCALGSYEALVRLKRISAGVGTEEDVAAIQRISDDMLEASRCIKGKDTAKFLLNALKTEAFRQHLEGHCEERECPSYIIYRIIPEKCVVCRLCQDACKYHAIIGQKRVSYRSGHVPFEIRQKRCVKCGECVKVCITNGKGKVDLVRVREAIEGIGYEGWLVIEGAVPANGDLMQSYLANQKYVRQLFQV